MSASCAPTGLVWSRMPAERTQNRPRIPWISYPQDTLGHTQHEAAIAMLVAGARVQLQNIVTQTELNGQYGELVAEATQERPAYRD